MALANHAPSSQGPLLLEGREGPYLDPNRLRASPSKHGLKIVKKTKKMPPPRCPREASLWHAGGMIEGRPPCEPQHRNGWSSGGTPPQTVRLPTFEVRDGCGMPPQPSSPQNPPLSTVTAVKVWAGRPQVPSQATKNNPSRRMELPHWCARAEDGHVDTRAPGPRRSGAKYYRPVLSPIGRLEGNIRQGCCEAAGLEHRSPLAERPAFRV